MSSLDWWDSCHLMFLAVTNEMTAAQQQRIVKTLRGLAELREQQGDILCQPLLSCAGG